MNIRLLSDMHMEFWKDKTFPWVDTPNDVLILAGDIAVGPAKLQAALEHFSKISDHVIYVFGNHEYYGYNLHSYDKLNVPDNVHILNPGYIKIGDVTFIGATLWTDFRNDPHAEMSALAGITDFKRIKNGDRRFSTDDCKNLFLRDSTFILDAANKLPGKKIIVTHFLPSHHCISPYWQKNGGVLNKYFAPSLDAAINQLEDVPYWFFGHTHDQVDIMIHNTRFVANPFGYHGYEDQRAFNCSLILEV